METKKLKNNNETYLYRDDSFNTFSINLNFLTNQDNRSTAILDVLCMYLMRCNQVYKTEDDIVLRERELYNMYLNFKANRKGKQEIFTLEADLISMDVIDDDYSKEAFEFIKNMLLKPDFTNEEVLELVKRILISYIDVTLSDYRNYASTLYNETVLPDENTKYDNTVDKKYIEELINSITLDDLKREYEVLINNYINGLVLGNINEDQFNEFVDCMDLKPINHDLDFSIDTKTTEGDIEVEKDCKQSYIYVTYDFTTLTNAEFRILTRILNSGIGLCMKTLREKYGLVYGARAGVLFHQKKLYIYGETDASKKEKFVEAVDEIIASLSNKEILEKYMKQAKEEIADDEDAIDENKDRLVNILNNRILKRYGDKDREIVNKEIEEMKPEEIMGKAKTLNKKNVFMVRGKSNA